LSSSTLLELNSNEKDKLCLVARALSVPSRIDIISLLYQKPLSIVEVAQELKIPASSVGVHIKILEEAGIIKTTKKTLDGAVFKICHVQKYLVNIILRSSKDNINQVSSVQIPIGSFTNCYADFPCGLISESRFIGTEDELRSFFLLEKSQSQLIWMSKGFLEYKAPNIVPKYKKPKKLSLSMELCSEAPGFDETYKSDIYLSVNDIDCGFYRAEGDYGLRRGIYTPNFWQNGLTQYGKLVTWSIDDSGVYLNYKKIMDRTLKDFKIEESSCITFKLESKEESEYCGGFNLFGEKAGDYNQSIILTVEH
jgi:predicted transcriptional regulator